MSSTALTIVSALARRGRRSCVRVPRVSTRINHMGKMPAPSPHKPKTSFLDEPSLTGGQNKPFFQPISETTGGLIDANKRLDSKLDDAGRGHLISRKRASRWAGRTVKPGCAGLYVKEYGLDLKDLAVVDRRFKGETARTLDSHTIRALQAQVEAVNVDHENSDHVKAQEGALRVTQVAAKQLEAKADATACTVIANAKAQAEAVEIAAQARAHAVRLEAVANAEVKAEQARRMQLARIDVDRVAAYGKKAVFVPDAGASARR